MRALAMTFGGRNNVSVQWNAEKTAFPGLIQKVTNGVLTQLGTDTLVANRGTNALKELLGHGAYDLMGIQHTLNFAASKALDDVRAFETATDPADKLASVQMRLAGVVDNTAKSILVVGNQAGSITSSNLTIE